MLDKKHELYKCDSLNMNEINSWILEGPNLALINSVNNFGEYLSKDLKNVKVVKKRKERTQDESITTSQIRQIFAKMKSIEAKGGFLERKEGEVKENKNAKIEFLMLKPLMAYAKKRHDTVGMMRLVERLDWAIDAVISADDLSERQKRFKNFCKLFEAILAYHRAHGGK